MQNARTVGYISHPPKSRGITFSYCPSEADLPKDLINYEVLCRFRLPGPCCHCRGGGEDARNWKDAGQDRRDQRQERLRIFAIRVFPIRVCPIRIPQPTVRVRWWIQLPIQLSDSL